MRKELYTRICERLSRLYVKADGGYLLLADGNEAPEGCERAIRHIDLWNHNVEFIEQEEQWERPAVFVEFTPLVWFRKTKDLSYYTADGTVYLHVVTDWHGSVSAGSEFREESLRVFDLLDAVINIIDGMNGADFKDLRLSCSHTNHNHEELVESIEHFTFRAEKRMLF